MTNKTDTEQLRAEFEAWAQNSFELHRHSAGEYSSNFTQTAWAAWQAGRASLQSQDREDMDQWLDQLRILITEFGIACADSGAVEMHMMPKIFDHARRAVGES